MESEEGSESLSKIGPQDQDDQGGAVHDRASDTAKCHLLALPPELRNEIFSLVVKQSHWIFLGPRGRGSTPPRLEPIPRPLLEPALLRTCQQIRVECLPLFYGLNIFKINNLLYQGIKHRIWVPPTMEKNMDKVKYPKFKVRAMLYLDLDFRAGINNCRPEIEDPFEGSEYYRKHVHVRDSAEALANRFSALATKVLRQACDRGELRLTNKTFNDLTECFL